jgi:hypothetical protein
MRDWPVVEATEPDLLIGSFHHPAFGTWVFDESSNVRVIPNGTQMSTPWLEHRYGESRPIFANVGGGRYKGVLE